MSASAVTRVLGVRHHGPGSARSVRSALEEFDPTIVLVEGPADADDLVPLVAEADMHPPVALLAHVAGSPETSVSWPFASFSPEWQALTWALARGVPARFMDLPAAQLLARAGQGPGDAGEEGAAARVRLDPVAALARAGGYDDPERWWEDLVEHRPSAGAADGSVFDALTEAMAALRADLAPGGAAPGRDQRHELRREAHMRSVLRAALREGHERVAVVCGAWHAPALSGKLPTVAADAALLKGAAKVRTTITWVPWTHGRLATASGYGAGIASPGWYDHLFTAPDRPVTRWLTAVAGVLRADDLPVSSASVIEAVRLAEALASLRGRPLAGLAEVTEATRSVLCEGDDVLLDVVTRRLVVGERLGAVAAAAPTLPLAADLRTQQKRVRMAPDAVVRDLALDLRTERDRERSRLLHRLRLLGVGWGRRAEPAARSTGTFREGWQLAWRPELAVDLVVASRWGTTVVGAATGRLGHTAAEGDLAEVTAAVEDALLADLPAALPGLLTALDARAAREADVTSLMAALPPLVRALRYGDVRGTAVGALDAVAAALLVRVCAGLPAAAGALDDEAAAALRTRVEETDASVELLADPARAQRWRAVLLSVADRDGVHPLLAGRITRLLRDAGTLEPQEAATRTARALSGAVPAAAKAAWVEGFLAGGGLLLVHDADLLVLLDGWLCGLRAQEFLDVLPLLRRTFSTFAPPERRQLGSALGGSGPRAREADEVVDVDRARRALRAVAELMGVS